MAAKNDITVGQRFGRLVVKSLVSPVGSQRICRYEVECDCGTLKVVPRKRLIVEKVQSCGCVWRISRPKSHGYAGKKTRPKIYNIWKAMVNRCHCSGNTSYGKYGGRGIKVCDRWRDFLNFYADMGDIAEGMTLDRIDVNGDYEPSNCRWADRHRQARNKRNTAFLTYRGETKSIHDWADQFGLKAKTIKQRLKSGWGAEEALTRPLLSIFEISKLGTTAQYGNRY